MTEPRRWWQGPLLGIGCLYTLTAPLFLIQQGKTAMEASIALLAGLIVVLASRVNDIVSWKLGPLQAQLRETIREGTATINQVRELAVVQAKVALSRLMVGYFYWDTVSLAARLDMHDEVIGNLRALGLSDDQIAAADEVWRINIGKVYANRICKILKKQGDLHSELKSRSAELVEQVNETVKSSSSLALMRDGIEQVLQEAKLDFPETLEWANDLRHYEATGKIGRKERFVADQGS